MGKRGLVAIVILIVLAIVAGIFLFSSSAAPVQNNVMPSPGIAAPSTPAAPQPSPLPAPAAAAAPAEPNCNDPTAYYYHYSPDVKAAGMNALQHWNQYGYAEKRKSCWPAPAPVAAPAPAPAPAAAQVAGLAVGGNYSMKSDIGGYLMSSNGVINANNPTPVAWTVEAGRTPGTVLLKASDGTYAVYCNKCDGRVVKTEQVVTSSDRGRATDWTPVQSGNTYSFFAAGNGGMFMSRCNGCGVHTNIVTAHERAANGWSTNFTLARM